MENIYFEMKKLCVGYHGIPLIRDIQVEIGRGEILTLIGPNGSGKSTILKSITKQLKLLGGTAWIDRQMLNEMSVKDLAKKQAVVLTERLKTDMMSCWEVVATGRYPYTDQIGRLSDADYQMVQEAMETVLAYDIRDKDFGEISDGQRQRIMLARAICQEPEIMILDEPTSFLDIRHKLELLDILRNMAKEKGIAVIMSLHEIDLAQKISDKIMCVKGEYIEQIGTPETIFQDDIIQRLYDVKKGTYNILFGSVELPKTEGVSKVFVIAGEGTGVAVYRAMQKEGIPFSTGVIYTNDVDYQVAKVLANQVITELPFQEIRKETLAAAMEEMDRCDYVIDAGVTVRKGNQGLNQLIQKAKESRKLFRREEKPWLKD
ncbi:MAG: ABC transporter ATP-binding protein [Hespellia sp.]|nr:ABC transporter ATP-binding protein [Hespellia sp.]